MKKTIGILFPLLLVLNTAFAADLNRFLGHWKNSDQNTRGITVLDIGKSGANITVQAWGKCSPSDCDWGRTTGYAYTPDIKSNPATMTEALSALFKTDFSETTLIIRFSDDGTLNVEALTRFTDNSKRSNYQSLFTFEQAEAASSGGDCITYNPDTLKIVNEWANGWLLTDGNSRMQMLDNEQDAKNALALARRYSSQCFIGRDNKRANRADYIVEFWGGDTGQATTLTKVDALPFNPANLKIVDEGSKGWLLTDGTSRMLMLDNEQDAQAALNMASQFTKHCFIGRDNKRPNRKAYIIEYWE
jgi:hypothetical protein